MFGPIGRTATMNTLPLDWRAAPLHSLLRGRPLLRPEHVLLQAPVNDLRQAFDTIGRMAQAPRGPSAEVLSDRLMRREAQRCTLAADGIALPHAQVPGLRSPVAAFLRPAEPLRLAEGSAAPVHDMLALLVPKPAAVPHFELLDRLLRLLREPLLQRELARCSTAIHVCQLFATLST